MPLNQLNVDDGRFVRFTNDGYGNGFCLDLRGDVRDVLPIVFWDHDDHEVRPFATSFESFFRTWAALGFAIDHAADGDLEAVSLFLEKGKLPRKKKQPPALITGRAIPLPREIRPLPADLQVYAAVLLPDGESALTAGASSILRNVNLAEARVVKEVHVGHYIYGLATKDGRQVFSAGEGGVHVIDIVRGTVTKVADGAHHVVAIAGAGADELVVVGAKDGTLAAYGTTSREERWRRQIGGKPFASLHVTASGLIVTHTSDAKAASVTVHTAIDGAEVARLEGGFLRPGSGVALSADGTEVLAPIGSGSVARIALMSGRLVSTPPATSSDGLNWYRIAQLDADLVIVGRDGAFEVWSLTTGEVRRSLHVEHGGVPSAILSRGDGARVLLASYLGWFGEWTVTKKRRGASR